MEGVGARLGRSSTRYGGPATVFTGKVRKWRKKWVPLSNPNNNNHHHHNSNNNGGGNSNGPSHLLIYKWAPLARDSSAPADGGAVAASSEEPPRKKFRYVPIAVIEEQKQEEVAASSADVMVSDEENRQGEDVTATEPAAQMDGAEEKTEVIDVKEEDNEALDKEGVPANEVSENSLDLNLGLKARDGDGGGDQRMEEDKCDDQ